MESQEMFDKYGFDKARSFLEEESKKNLEEEARKKLEKNKPKPTGNEFGATTLPSHLKQMLYKKSTLPRSDADGFALGSVDHRDATRAALVTYAVYPFNDGNGEEAKMRLVDIKLN